MEKLSLEILKKVQQKSKDLAIVMSIPGIGFISASVVLSEIGNYRDFQNPNQLANGVASIQEKTNLQAKRKKCGITKRGSKHIRLVLVQAAQTISRMKTPGCPDSFQRLTKKKEHNVAIIAVAGNSSVSFIIF